MHDEDLDKNEFVNQKRNRSNYTSQGKDDLQSKATSQSKSTSQSYCKSQNDFKFFIEKKEINEDINKAVRNHKFTELEEIEDFINKFD